MAHFVYILYSPSTDHFYKGQTNDLEKRLMRHNLRQEKATQFGSPWILLWTIDKASRSKSMILEQKLKNLSRKRLIAFMQKYPEGISEPIGSILLEKISHMDAGPDVPQQRKSGC